jgi:hypothetical protein
LAADAENRAGDAPAGRVNPDRFKTAMTWRGILFHNAGWKLTSLLLATVVWFTFRSVPDTKFELTPNFVVTTATRQFVRHPVSVLAKPGGSLDLRMEPAAVDITVSGQKNSLRNLTGRDIQAFITVSDQVEPVTNRVRVYVPSGVVLERIDPAYVRVTRPNP